MNKLEIKWERAGLVSYMSNQSAYVAQSLSMGGEVAFDATTLTKDNEVTFIYDKITDAINSLVPHFARIIDDNASVTDSESNVGIEFTPRIEGGAYSKAEFAHIKSLSQKYVVSYILTDWYSLKGITAMSGYFAAQYAQSGAELDAVLDRFVRPVRRNGVSIRSVSIIEGEQRPAQECSEVDVDCSDPVEGSELIMSFRMEPTNDVHLEDCEFEVQYYTTTIEKCHAISKSNMTHKSADEYLAKVKTDLTGAGTLKYVTTITMPNDGYAEGDKLKVIKNVTTSVNIRPMPK
ncbi:MAG: hypothetical protein J6U49_07515 [Alistipes sp.]|nr:hypothetical protein [Alistipes sp.]